MLTNSDEKSARSIFKQISAQKTKRGLATIQTLLHKRVTSMHPFSRATKNSSSNRTARSLAFVCPQAIQPQHRNSKPTATPGLRASRATKGPVSFRTTTTTVLQHASSTRRSRRLLQIFLNDADKRYLALPCPSVASDTSDMLRSSFRTLSSTYFGVAKSWSNAPSSRQATRKTSLAGR